MKVMYLLTGQSGEYSDRTEWYCGVFDDKLEAERIAAKWTAAAELLNYSDPHRWEDDFKWDHPDPNFYIDYTGTEYYVSEVPYNPVFE